MAKANERQKQKKREKHQRKRKQAKAQAAAKQREQALPTSERGLVKLASAGEFGPTWICEGWDSPEAAARPVLIVITRRLRGRLYLGHCVFVDRSCMGIRDAFTLAPADEHELAAQMADGGPGDETMIPCEVTVAQSVVFHALDYANSLGFRPHRDFQPAMFEPRPAELLETAGAHPERPSYYPGADDEIAPVLVKLDKAVGRGNYDFMGLPTGDQRFRVSRDDARYARVPPDRPLHPDDAGADPTRINWKLACTDVPWEPPLLPELRDLRPSTAAPRSPRWETDEIERFLTAFESERLLLWEAIMRREQGLALTREHTQLLSELPGGDEVHIELIDGRARPCEPWYHTFDRLLDRTLVDRVETQTSFDETVLYLSAELIDLAERHAPPLSLPPDVSSLEQLLDDHRVSRARIQPLFDVLIGLGQNSGPEGRITLADPAQFDRVDEFLDGFHRHAKDLERLGWGLAEVLEIVVLPEDQRVLLLDAIAAREPELTVGLRSPG